MDTKSKQTESKELSNYMANYYGTECYYSGGPLLQFLFTDGVKAFCEKAGAYWFLMESRIAINHVKEDFLAIHLDVKEDASCEVFVIGEKGHKCYSKHIPFTDCPIGEWVFYYDRPSNVFLWNGEY